MEFPVLILPGTGRGTIRRMVEGHAPNLLRPKARAILRVPLHPRLRRRFPSPGGGGLPEHPVKNRIDMLQMIAKIELVLDFLNRKRGGDIGIRLQQFEQ
jgi:hypothetical protein